MKKRLSNHLASSFNLEGPEGKNIPIRTSAGKRVLLYSALDCLFDALLAVAGYVKV
jgi:hypothetical protein